MCSRFSSSAPRCCGRQHLHDLLRLAVADRLRPHHRHHLLDVAVVRGLGQDLLAQEAGGAGEQHVQARVAAARRELRASPRAAAPPRAPSPPAPRGASARGTGRRSRASSPRAGASPAPRLRVAGELAHRARPRAPRLDPLSPFLTRLSLPVSSIRRLARNWAAISTGWLSRCAWTSSSSGSIGSASCLPVARSTLRCTGSATCPRRLRGVVRVRRRRAGDR